MVSLSWPFFLFNYLVYVMGWLNVSFIGREMTKFLVPITSTCPSKLELLRKLTSLLTNVLRICNILLNHNIYEVIKLIRYQMRQFFLTHKSQLVANYTSTWLLLLMQSSSIHACRSESGLVHNPMTHKKSQQLHKSVYLNIFFLWVYDDNYKILLLYRLEA